VINRSSKLVSCIIVACTIMGISKLQGADDVSCCHRLGTRLRFASSASDFAKATSDRMPIWHDSSYLSLSLSRLSHFWTVVRSSLNLPRLPAIARRDLPRLFSLWLPLSGPITITDNDWKGKYPAQHHSATRTVPDKHPVCLLSRRSSRQRLRQSSYPTSNPREEGHAYELITASDLSRRLVLRSSKSEGGSSASAGWMTDDGLFE